MRAYYGWQRSGPEQAVARCCRDAGWEVGELSATRLVHHRTLPDVRPLINGPTQDEASRVLRRGCVASIPMKYGTTTKIVNRKCTTRERSDTVI
jgi:hypothetical protein